MYNCPHCSAPTISGWRKSSSSPFFPARCRECGGESAISGWGRTVTAIGGQVLLWGSIIFAFVVGSPFGILALPLGFIAMTAAANRAFPLVAIDQGLTVARKRAVKLFGVA